MQPKHVEMSAEYAAEILKKLKVDKKTTTLLLNCVLAHHGQVPYQSKEAEICANADAYRFVSERGVFTTYKFALDLGKNHNKALDFAKEELTGLYHTLSDILKKARI